MTSNPAPVASASLGKPSADEAIAWLAAQRRQPNRQSAQTVEYGELVLEGGHLKRLGDDVWSFLEQVALGALDLGKTDLAELCISRLNTRFPGSARVAALQGMLLESRGEYQKALKLYNDILLKDESSLIIVKRMIAVLRCIPGTDGRTGPAGAVTALTKYLDTYYQDAEAWQELVAIYLEQNMYPQAAHALEELLILVPHNTFYVLQYAELLATQGELALAYKEYLRVLEMCEGKSASNDVQDQDDCRQGPFARALWGLKLVTSKLRAGTTASASGGSYAQQRKGGKNAAATSEQPELKPQKLDAVDAMVTDLLLNQVYKGSSAGVRASRDAARKVLAA